MKHCILPSLIALVLLLSSPLGLAQNRKKAKLGIGDPAPALAIEHWFSLGDGAFKEVTSFEKGHVYVLDFWATWCGPCVASMPHLGEIQKAYADKNVQVISISDEDEETVAGFLKEKVRGGTGTYGDLTGQWCLTTDPDASAYADYMNATRQKGIPTVFIVGKTGKLEWIGHPMAMDPVLKNIVDDTWDATAHALVFEEMQKCERAQGKIFKALRRDKTDQAIKMIDDLLVSLKSEAVIMQTRMFKLSVLSQLDGRDAAIAGVVGELLSGIKADTDPEKVNELTWTFFEMAEAGLPLSKDQLRQAAVLAREAAQRSPAGPGKAMILDTAAHLYHRVGEVRTALDLERKAVENDDTSEEINAFLAQLKKLAI
ncbi:MAG: thiol-disulfide isomerase/thioredoxin [Kiritimatiellia bacterium]|jgi:thiol-disulfide isomerase/thioredoxin